MANQTSSTKFTTSPAYQSVLWPRKNHVERIPIPGDAIIKHAEWLERYQDIIDEGDAHGWLDWEDGSVHPKYLTTHTNKLVYDETEEEWKNRVHAEMAKVGWLK